MLKLSPFGTAFVRRWREIAQRHMAAFLRGDVSFQEQRHRRIRELIPNLVDAETDALFGIYLEAYEANWRPFADVEGCLTARSGHQLGVISNGSRPQQLQKVQTLGIAEHFSFVLSAEAAGVAKPDPAIFWQAEKLAGKTPAECFYIGDNFCVDAEAAARAGWCGVWLDRNSYGAKTGLNAGLPILTTLDLLPALIAQKAYYSHAPISRRNNAI